MALTNGQVMEVVELFTNNFMLEKNTDKKLRLFQSFDDVFGKGIKGWTDMVLNIMGERGIDQSIVQEYIGLMNQRKDETCDYEIREMVENDFWMVCEILNYAFDKLLTIDSNAEQLRKFITGYSFVACNKDDILGVALACVIPGLNMDTIYVDSLAVAPFARRKGIARNLLKTIQKKAYKNEIYSVKLMTDRQLEAYKMYRHLGFNESKYVLMTKW